MDDAQGITRPSDPSRYTLRFDADGTVQLRLDCNRARGTWSARPAADSGSGSLRFGPLATTRALCPAPSLGERLGTEVSYVRSYLLKDGRLHLSLLADGGILVWQPLKEEGRASRTPDPKLEAAILRASPDVAGLIRDQAPSPQVRYVHARYDLNGDGRDEVFAYLMGPIFCGTGGCTLELFRQGDEDDRLMNTFPITRLPLIVSPRRTRGWHDLWKREAGGGAPPTWVRHVFDGSRYVQKQRLPAEPIPQGTPLFRDDPGFSDGIPLLPGR